MTAESLRGVCVCVCAHAFMRACVRSCVVKMSWTTGPRSYSTHLWHSEHFEAVPHCSDADLHDFW